jgi:hypothetical protein
MNLSEFLSLFNVRSECERADDNPNMSDEKWKKTANHYKCSLRRGKFKMQVPFSMGSAHKKGPSTKDVIEALALDASAYEAAGKDFDAWADDLGADKNCPCSRKTFKIVGKQSRMLKRVLGNDGYKKPSATVGSIPSPATTSFSVVSRSSVVPA